jgi:hypothetical protein
VVRNHGIDNPDVEAFWQGSIDYAFAIQDKPMIEAQQAALGDTHIETHRPVAIPADVSGGRARRNLARLIAGEANGERPKPGGGALDELLRKSTGSKQPVLPVV